MKCEPTKTPEHVDISALKEKYRQERDKRLNAGGETQYRHAAGALQDYYVTDPHKPVAPRAPIAEDIDVAILGAGFGGILAAYHLAQAEITSFRNIDHAGDFGGVWYWNRYPGIQCDNESYCYLPLLEETGFMPSKRFADGAEIHEYSRLIARKFGFSDKALFHTLITALRWDETIKRWRVCTNRGDVIHARFVVMAGGVMNMPKLPGIMGIDQFKGHMFHTSRWDYAYTGGNPDYPVLDKLSDKRVAITGTGATAIQAVPYLARHSKQVYVLQRTPPSVDERPNPPTDAAWVKTLQPGWQQERQANYQRAVMEFPKPGEPDLVCDIWTEINRNLIAQLAAEGWPELNIAQLMSRREIVDYQVMERLRNRIDSIVTDPQTAQALKPYYRLACKRPLSSDSYYPAFNQPNVELIDVSDTKGVERITAKGFVVNGVEHEVDCILFASGFEVTSELERRWGIDVVTGRDGRSIYDHWRNGPRTLHGTMTHGFPNQFYIGYVQGGLNASVPAQFGAQAHHIAYVISETHRRGIAAVEPTQAAQDAYVAHFEEVAIDTSEFQRECTPSYYTNEGQVKAPWALLRGYGPGWAAFMKLLQDWRDKGDMAGLDLRK